MILPLAEVWELLGVENSVVGELWDIGDNHLEHLGYGLNLIRAFAALSYNPSRFQDTCRTAPISDDAVHRIPTIVSGGISISRHYSDPTDGALEDLMDLNQMASKVCVHINRIGDATDGQSVERRRQPHQATAARGGSRMQQRPRKWQPRMPLAVARGGSRASGSLACHRRSHAEVVACSKGRVSGGLTR
ncbi:hypothetical protein BHE74_00050620 [Ensete ventricosum]|nr:hypothetical protein BHE74_00050620 [Ensete ventricosum]